MCDAIFLLIKPSAPPTTTLYRFKCSIPTNSLMCHRAACLRSSWIWAMNRSFASTRAHWLPRKKRGDTLRKRYIWNGACYLLYRLRLILFSCFNFAGGHTQRGCLFPDELPEKFGGRYKRSDCVVNCRIESIAALCNCRLFYLPTTQQDGDDFKAGKSGRKERSHESGDVSVCTLEHVQCLNHYRSEVLDLWSIAKGFIFGIYELVKWSTTVLDNTKVVGLEMEIQDGLYCPDCLPSCSDTIYTVSVQSLPLIPTKRSYINLMYVNIIVQCVSRISTINMFL